MQVHNSIVGKGSFIQRIQFSDALQGVFRDCISHSSAKVVDGSRIKDMRARKHRFEIAQRPYVRMCLFYEALIGTASTTMRGRSGKQEAKSAEEWLEQQDAEMAIQAAMMGDAGDEMLQLIRFFDNEAFDLTKVHQTLIDFHTRLRALFVDGLCVQTGLTGVMLQSLRDSPKLVHLRAGVKQIGGPGAVTDAVIARCLGRMAAWTKLGEAISKSEFPGFELLQALGPFNLEQHTNALNMNTTYVRECFHRLCQVLKLSAKDGFDEYCHYLPLAVEHWRRTQDNFEAWSAALSRPPRCRPGYGATLQQLVKRIGAWGGSTSGVEQSFAKQRTSQGLHRSEMSGEHVNIDACIMSMCSGCPFKSDGERALFMQSARAAWSRMFGHARATSRLRRRDKGRPSNRKGAQNSEKEWLRKRTLEVAAGVAAGRVVKRARVETAWTDSHQKELDLQVKRQMINKVQAFADGVLLPSEITEDIPNRKTSSEIHEATKYIQRQRFHAKHTLQRAVHSPLSIAGRLVLVDPAVATPALAETVRSTARLTDQREDAHVFIVPDVANLGQRISWCLSLGGGFACTAEYITTGSQKGVAVAFKPAVKSLRFFCISDAFAAAHPVLSALIALKALRPPSVWRPLTAAEILAKRARAPAKTCNQLVVFLAVSDVQAHTFDAIKHQLTAKSALSFLTQPDVTVSCMNVCGG